MSIEKKPQSRGSYQKHISSQEIKILEYVRTNIRANARELSFSVLGEEAGGLQRKQLIPVLKKLFRTTVIWGRGDDLVHFNLVDAEDFDFQVGMNVAKKLQSLRSKKG